MGGRRLHGLTYGGTTIGFSCSGHAPQSVLDEVVSFFEPYGERSTHDVERTDIHLDVRDWVGFDRSSLDYAPVAIRRSSAQAFNFHGVEARTAGEHIVISESTRTAFRFHRGRAAAALFVSPGSTVQVTDFLRDIILKKEERRGAVILHASAVEIDGQAIVIAGEKGAGKTTLLYELIATGRAKRVSGDKVLLDPGRGPHVGDVHVRGWPDYPHVGIGTIRSHRRLEEALDRAGVNLDERPDTEKILFAPSILDDVFGAVERRPPLPLAAIVHPSIVDRGRHVRRVVPLGSSEGASAVDEVLRHVEPTRRNPFAHWHELVTSPTDDEAAVAEAALQVALGGVPSYRTHGDGVAEDLLSIFARSAS